MSVVSNVLTGLFLTIMQVIDGNIILQVPPAMTLLGLILGTLTLVLLLHLCITRGRRTIETPRVEGQTATSLAASSISDLASFDEEFEAIKNEDLQETRLQLFKDRLCKLLAIRDESDKDIPPRVAAVLDWISKNLYDPKTHRFFFDYLLLIAKHDGKSKELVRAIFSSELETLYDGLKSDPLPTLLELLQRLNDFDEAFMIRLIDDAVLRWSDSGFENLRSGLLLSKVNKSIGAYYRVKQYILGSAIQAGKDGKEQARLRAEALYAQMKW